jgi:hypothetical protein
MAPATTHSLMLAWARIISDFVESIMAGIVVVLLTRWVRNKNAGHKRALRIIRGCAAIWAVLHLYWAGSIYFDSRRYSEFVVFSLCTLVMVVCATIVYDARNIENTLETSQMATDELSAEAKAISAKNDALLIESIESKLAAERLVKKIQRGIVEQHVSVQ